MKGKTIILTLAVSFQVAQILLIFLFGLSLINWAFLELIPFKEIIVGGVWFFLNLVSVLGIYYSLK